MRPSGHTLRERRFAPVHLAPLCSVCDIQRVVADKAAVPNYYESRISKLSLNGSELPKLKAELEEITEGDELTKRAAPEVMDGKAMIVCMSRCIAVDLYVALRPDLASAKDDNDADDK